MSRDDAERIEDSREACRKLAEIVAKGPQSVRHTR